MGMAALGGAGISALGSIFGASKTSDAAKQAANAQVKSAQIAADTQRDMFGQARNALQPYMNIGNDATYLMKDNLMSYLGGPAPPTAPGPMTQAELESTPGYGFTLGQGLKATQSGAAARGLGVSGAAMKGAATYATGLSDQTYGTRFNQQQQLFGNQQTIYGDQVANNTNAFNKLQQIAGIGTGAAGALAGQAVQTGQGIAQTQIGAGNAQAAGINAAGQATAAGITGTTGALNNALSQYMTFNALQNGGGLFSGGGSGGYQGWMSKGYGG